MVTRNDSLWKSLDWVTICIYLLLGGEEHLFEGIVEGRIIDRE